MIDILLHGILQRADDVLVGHGGGLQQALVPLQRPPQSARCLVHGLEQGGRLVFHYEKIVFVVIMGKAVD